MKNNADRRPYTILPFWFKRKPNARILLVNETGEYHYISSEDFNSLISYSLSNSSTTMQDLKSKHFIAGNDLDLTIDMAATKYRTRKRYLSNFTALHMMVITLRCNHRCEYCQVSCEDQDAHKYDMSPSVAKKIVDYIFQSPSPVIKIEFQGGEPLLNWTTIKAVVDYAKELNRTFKKVLEFVVCTNLTLINRDHLEYIRDNQIYISTSLDGPQKLHNMHRKLRNGKSSHDLFVDKLMLVQDELGKNRVSALMTFTRSTCGRIKEVIDEYIRLGFDGIFLRSLNPYGLAAINAINVDYPMEKFVASYREALEYIIMLNLKGIRFVEYYTTLLLSRILTPFATGFVDLQSPSGAGISGAIYDYNGDVYPADEARMLARMGDYRFWMGNVLEHSYHDIFNGIVVNEIVKKSCLEIIPGCSNCVYRPYCGADPIRNYLEFGDIVGNQPSSNFCLKHMGMFDTLFNLLDQNNHDVIDVFWSWITQRNLEEVRLA